jgi:hypothetical protein
VFFLGWMTLAGVEIWNVERTTTYLHANVPALDLSGCDECHSMALALGDAPYKNSPVDDPAPWVSPDPDLNDFYGFLPMSMEGLWDSTIETTITQSLGDGGTASTPRRRTREMRVEGVILARTRVALTKGRAWLRNAVQTTGCDNGAGCGGDDMCFFADCPTSLAQGDELMRTLRDVVSTDGPRIVQPFGRLSSGVYMDKIEFTLVATSPWVYGAEDYLGSTMGTLGTTTGALVLNAVAPALPECYSGPPPPVLDPNVPYIPPPPRPPSVLNALQPPARYQSGYSVLIPASHVPDVMTSVLRIALTTGSQAASWIRLRLYAAPLGPTQTMNNVDPCSFCGDITVTYIPANRKFVIDGMNQSIYIEDTSGNRQPANHLAFTGAAHPTQWALLSCAMDYWLTVETPGVTNALNLFVTGATSDSSTFTTNLGAWSNGVPDGSPAATLTRDTAQFHNGPASMKINWPANSRDKPQVLLTGLVEGIVYSLSAWVKSPTARVRVGIGSTGAQSSPNANWQQVSTTFQAQATTAMVQISRDTILASGDLWVDDFVLQDVETATSSIAKVDVSMFRRL